MVTRGGLLLLCVSLRSACPVIPTEPSVLVLPAVGKLRDVFEADEMGGRSYAQQQISVNPEPTAAPRTLQQQDDRAYIQCLYS
jgi:hypothetical protein